MDRERAGVRGAKGGGPGAESEVGEGQKEEQGPLEASAKPWARPPETVSRLSYFHMEGSVSPLSLPRENISSRAQSHGAPLWQGLAAFPCLVGLVG